MDVILKFLGMLFILIFGIIYSGFVFSIMWLWFIVPVFGLPELTIAYAIGISMTFSYPFAKFDQTTDDDDMNTLLIKATMQVFLKPTIALISGYIIHLFV